MKQRVQPERDLRPGWRRPAAFDPGRLGQPVGGAGAAAARCAGPACPGGRLHATGQAPLATEAVRRIGLLYAIEQDIRGRPPDERARQRQARAGPILESLRAWFDETLARVSGRSDLAVAIRYARSRWEALTRYGADGRLEIDSNPVERAIRPLALGRKNWLFAGSDTGGQRAATIASLIATAKLNGLDPEAYLRRVLERIADHPVSRVAELLPGNLPSDAEPTAS